MQACVLPTEIIIEIAYQSRDVYVVMSATCRRLRKELDLVRGMDSKRWLRRYVSYWRDSAMILDRYWGTTCDTGTRITYWMFDRMIEFLYPDNRMLFIQYKWNVDDPRVGYMRKLTRAGPWPNTQCDISWEHLTPCTTFEAVINELLDHPDLVIWDSYKK